MHWDKACVCCSGVCLAINLSKEWCGCTMRYVVAYIIKLTLQPPSVTGEPATSTAVDGAQYSCDQRLPCQRVGQRCVSEFTRSRS